MLSFGKRARPFLEKAAREAEMPARVLSAGMVYELDHPEEGSKAVLNAIPDPKKEEIHPHQTVALAERVRERLQESGYLLAEVSAQLKTGTTGPVLHIAAEPGMVRKVQSIFRYGYGLLRQILSLDPGLPGLVSLT